MDTAPDLAPDTAPDAAPDTLPDTGPDGDHDALMDGIAAPDVPGIEVGPSDAPQNADAGALDATAPPSCQGAGTLKTYPPAIAAPIGRVAVGPDGTPWFASNINTARNASGVEQAVPVDLGNGAPVGSTYSADIVLAKLSPSTLNATAAFAFGDYGNGAAATPPGSNDQFSAGIAVAGNGRPAIIGYFTGEVDFTGNNSDGTGSTGAEGQAGLDYLVSTSPLDFYALFDNTGAPVKSHMANLGTGSLLAIGSNPSAAAFAICGKTSALVPNYLGTNGANKGILKIPSGADYANAAGGSMDIVVAKVDAATGDVLWGRQIGGAGLQTCTAVALNAAGDVVLTGAYNGALDFGGASTALPTLGTASSIGALYVAVLDGATGAGVSAKAWGSAGINLPKALVVDAGGAIVVAGALGTGVDFGGGISVAALGLTDAFVVKLSPQLAPLWAKSYGDAQYNQEATDVAVSSTGDVTIVGQFAGSLGALGIHSNGNSNADAFLARLSGSTGDATCASGFGNAEGSQQFNSVAVARAAAAPLANAVFLAGSYSSAITVPPAATVTTPGNSDYQTVLVKLAD